MATAATLRLGKFSISRTAGAPVESSGAGAWAWQTSSRRATITPRRPQSTSCSNYLGPWRVKGSRLGGSRLHYALIRGDGSRGRWGDDAFFDGGEGHGQRRTGMRASGTSRLNSQVGSIGASLEHRYPRTVALYHGASGWHDMRGGLHAGEGTPLPTPVCNLHFGSPSLREWLLFLNCRCVCKE